MKELMLLVTALVIVNATGVYAQSAQDHAQSVQDAGKSIQLASYHRHHHHYGYGRMDDPSAEGRTSG
jgi:hypothetical protein